MQSYNPATAIPNEMQQILNFGSDFLKLGEILGGQSAIIRRMERDVGMANEGK